MFGLSESIDRKKEKKLREAAEANHSEAVRKWVEEDERYAWIKAGMTPSAAGGV